MNDVFVRESMFYSKNGETYDKKMSQITLYEVKNDYETLLASVDVDLAQLVGKKNHIEQLRMYDDLMMGLYLEVSWTVQPLTDDNRS